MDNTKHDRHLHLVRVGEDERVFRSVPRRVQSKRIRVPIRHSDDRLVTMSLRNVPAGMEQVKALGEDIIVDEAGVDGESPHKQDDVATAERKVSSAQGVCVEYSQEESTDNLAEV